MTKITEFYKFFFIGIGGISMSALAKLLKSKGFEVAGSDINKNMKLENIKVFHNHKPQNISGYNVIVYNSAIPKDNPEYVAATREGKQILSRAELLGKVAQSYKNVISISGTHGKTTVSTMISEVLLQANKKPTIHIGGISNPINSNLSIGDKKYFVTEACEFQDSFLTLENKIGVILNIEPEHLDYFQSFENVKISFSKFASHSKVIVIHDNYKKYLLNNYINNKKIITFGEGGNYTAKNIIITEKNKINFDCYFNNKFLDNFTLNAIGLHNIDNALAVIAVARLLKVKTLDIKKALSCYYGVRRRCEITNLQPLTIQDYAHHPSEINAIINAIKKHYLNKENNLTNNFLINKNNLNKSKLIVIFEPHTYSRTKTFESEFKQSLSQADTLLLYKTFPAREPESAGISAKQLFEELNKSHKDIYYYDNFQELKKAIKKIQKANDIVLILGAGELYDLFKKHK